MTEQGAVVIRQLNIWMMPCIVKLVYENYEVFEVYVEIEADRFYYGFSEDGIKRRWYKAEYEFMGIVI